MKKSTFKVILKNWLLQRRKFSAYVATTTVYRKTDMVVTSGVFKNLKYIENSSGGAYFPKLLGIYEKELYPVIASWSPDQFDHILNIGSGEGYYSNGLALRFPKANVVSYDPGFYACYLNQMMAERNNINSRNQIKAQFCLPVHLEQELSSGERTLVFMDVEGAELDLLDNEKIKGLNKAHILVEIHDTIGPHLAETILQRFKYTHKLTEIKQERRTMADLPFSSLSAKLFKKAFVKIMDEGRGYNMRWFYFEPLQ